VIPIVTELVLVLAGTCEVAVFVEVGVIVVLVDALLQTVWGAIVELVYEVVVL
jgi:hypothetical protein